MLDYEGMSLAQLRAHCLNCEREALQRAHLGFEVLTNEFGARLEPYDRMAKRYVLPEIEQRIAKAQDEIETNPEIADNVTDSELRRRVMIEMMEEYDNGGIEEAVKHHREMLEIEGRRKID